MYYSSEELGKRIAMLRKARKWTQKRLGEELHCTGKTISDYESAKNTPPIDNLFRLCDIFDCQLGFLLGEPDYSEGTLIETAIHKETGLTKEAMDAIRLVTGNCKASPGFGYHSAEYQSLLNRILTSNRFLFFMKKLHALDEAFCEYHSIIPNLRNQIGKERYEAASNLAREIEDLDPDEPGPDITQEQREDLDLFRNAHERMYDLIFPLKVYRYEAREAFEALLMDLYPTGQNE